MIAPNNNTPKPAAFEFHKRPAGYKEACPVCGCTAKIPTMEHRAVREGEEINARWVSRRKSGDGWKYKTIGKLALPKPVVPKIDHRIGPTDRVLTLLSKAATMAAYGKELVDICTELEIGLHNLMEWKSRHAALWDTIYSQAAEKVVKIVRQCAGTDAVLEDPDRYMQMATAAQRWSEKKGKPLFSASGDGRKTLSQFYKEYYLPNRLADASQATLLCYNVALRRWALLTGDPPLETIDNTMLANFRNALAKMKGIKVGTYLSPASIRRFLRHIQALIAKAGPPGPRNRDAAGIITTSPWCKPPRDDAPIVRVVSPGYLKLAYDAAAGMDVPQIPGIKPPAWWKALLVVAYNTGLRNRTLFDLRMEYIEWEQGRMVIPPEGMKSRRWHVIRLNATAIEHLRGIRTAREIVFPWPYRIERFFRHFHSLQDMAGIPRKDHFGLHTIRKTTATALWSDSPQAAQLALGHAASAVTMRHYIQGDDIVSKAIDALPQPWGPASTAIPS